MSAKFTLMAVAAAAAMGVATAAHASIIVEGSLVANLQSSDLSATSNIWTNQATGADSVGNFTKNGGGNLNVVSVSYNSQSYNALGLAGNGANTVISALAAPTAITGNKAVSVEEWVDSTSTSNTQALLAYGFMANNNQSSEYSYGSGGPFHGQFNDAGWNGYTPTTGVKYIAWVYEPGVATGGKASTLLVYVDGSLVDTAGLGNLNNQDTTLGVGAGNNGNSTASVATTWGRDVFSGDILAARVETGTLTASDIANNFAAGPLGNAAVPEPASLGLLGVGAVGLLMLRKRKTA